MTEIEKWIPAQGVPERVCIEALTDDYNNLRIRLFDIDGKGDCLEVVFDGHHGYRNIRVPVQLEILRYSPDLNMNWSFFVAKNTDFVSWLCEESYEVVNAESVGHYVIVASNCFVEVLAMEPPAVDWISYS